MAKEALFWAAGLTDLFLLVQIHITFGFLGRSARFNLLCSPIVTFFPHQSENLRNEMRREIYKVEELATVSHIYTSPISRRKLAVVRSNIREVNTY